MLPFRHEIYPTEGCSQIPAKKKPDENCQVSDGDVVPKDIVLLNLGPPLFAVFLCFVSIEFTEAHNL